MFTILGFKDKPKSRNVGNPVQLGIRHQNKYMWKSAAKNNRGHPKAPALCLPVAPRIGDNVTQACHSLPPHCIPSHAWSQGAVTAGTFCSSRHPKSTKWFWDTHRLLFQDEETPSECGEGKWTWLGSQPPPQFFSKNFKLKTEERKAANAAEDK